LGKDAFEPLTGAVPGAIATGGIGESAPSGRPRPDRPLGKRGADLLAQVPLFEGLCRGRVIGRAGPGEFFGEISLLDGGPRSATVVADTPVVAIRLFKSSFDRVIKQEPKVAAKILAVVARRLRDAERTISS